MKPKACLIPVGKEIPSELKEELIRITNTLSKYVNILVENNIYEYSDIKKACEKIRNADLDLLILFIIHGTTANTQVLIVERIGIPTIIWSLPERYSLPTSASALGILKDMGFRVKHVHESTLNPEVINKIVKMSKIAFTLKMLKNARICKIGGIMPVMVASHYNLKAIKEKFGVDIFRVPTSEFQEWIDKVNDEEILNELKMVKKKFIVEVDDENMKKALRISMSLRKMAEKLNINGFALECHTELTGKFKVNPCLGYLDERYAIGCEGDVVNCIAVLMAYYLTGIMPSIFDPFALTSNNVLELVHCACASSLAKSPEEVLISTAVPPAVVRVKATMVTCRARVEEGTVTIFRLHGMNVDKIHMTVGKLVSCNIKENVKLRVKLLGNPKHFIENICGNHYVVAKGDIRDEIRTLAKWLGIEVIES